MCVLNKHIEQDVLKPNDTEVLCQRCGSPTLKHKAPQISASLLAVNDVQDSALWAIAACRAGAERIHIDVNDGNEKPNGIAKAGDAGDTNQLFTPRQLDSIKESIHQAGFQTPVDVHLMTSEPSEKLLVSYLDAGVDSIAIHWESSNPTMLANQLRFIHLYSPKSLSALAIGPDADIDAIGTFLRETPGIVDIVSLCATMLGLGWLPFQDRILGYLRRLRAKYGYKGYIQVDGGVEPKFSAPMVRDAGADILVSGSAFFGQLSRPDPEVLRQRYLSLKGLDFKQNERYRIVKPSNRYHSESFSISLKCLECGVKEPTSHMLDKCPKCGGGLEFISEEHANFTSLIKDRQDMWRYQNLMPAPKNHIVSSGEGCTSVILLEDLGKQLGVTLYAKLESENPTGTFKDREASFVISRSAMGGLDNLVMQSTGNTGIAITYYAGLAGLDSFFFAPACSAYKLIGPPKPKYNKIILIKGHPIDVKNYATRFARVHGFPKISPFHERSEANATQAYEIGEGILEGQIPNVDYYVQTIAAGMGPIGFFKGMSRLSAWTKDRVSLPRIIAVQISEFAPAQHAWERNLEQLGPEAQTPTYSREKPFEPTLHTTNAPAYYPYLRRALKISKGTLIAIEPHEVISIETELRNALSKHSCFLAKTERASFVAYAGLVKLIRNGYIPHGSLILLMITGKGLKPDYEPIEPDAIIPPDYDCMLLLKQLRVGEVVRAVPAE